MNRPALPLVSVVMATYNGERYIEQQLLSILNQDYSNIEIIIVDDCSNDQTVKLIRNFIDKFKKIRLIELEKNLGAASAFEVGLGFAVGEYIALSDQDDIFDLVKISTMVEELQKNKNIDLVVSDLRLITETEQTIAESMWNFQKMNPRSGKPFSQLIYTNFITGCACMFTKRLLSAALPFPKNCIVHDWWLSVLATSHRFGGVLLYPLPLISYRQHNINVIGAHSSGLWASIKRAPNLHYRTEWYRRNCERIRGYLLNGTWDTNELQELEFLLGVFKGYVTDAENTIFTRVKLMPARLRFARTQNRSHFIGIIIFSLLPRVVELLNSLIPNANIGSERK